MLLADLRERTRGPRFWVVLGAVMVAAWWCFPPIEAGYTTVAVRGYARGEYSSAWVGMVMAMEFSTLLSLGGFYLVRGTLVRDIETRVWQLLVATPMTRGGYLLAKWASHMVVFCVVMLAGLAIGLVAQWVRAEDRAVDVWELLKPSIVLTLPGLGVTAAIAVWFDLLPWFRRTAGNIVFFIVWLTLTSVSLSQMDVPGSSARTGWRSDPNGMVVVARDLHRVRAAQTGKPQDYGFSIGMQTSKGLPTRFEWKEWQPRGMDILGRLLWLATALGGVLLAAPLLDWAAARTRAQKSGAGGGRTLRWLDRVLAPFARGPTLTIATAELKLVLRQRRLWWWLAAVAALALQAFGSDGALRHGMLLAWLLPLDILAGAALRERDNGTGGLVFAAPAIVSRLLLARLLVSLVLVTGLTLPGVLRLLGTAPEAAVAVLAIGASLVSWGLCLGALTRNPRAFELAILVLCYAALQGAGLLAFDAQAAYTTQWNLMGLLPAWLLLAWSWPRLARIR
jgi:hypothetical protein